MKDLVAQVKEAVAKGKSLEETKKSVDLSRYAAGFVAYKNLAQFQRSSDSAVERTFAELTGKIT
jgi:hypothetical protein